MTMKKSNAPLSKNDLMAISNVQGIFRKVDREVKRFKRLTGMHCPDRCGVCCAASKVDTTVI